MATVRETASTAGSGSPQKSLASSAGALLAAKIVFVLAGYAIYVGLSRLLSQAQFGTFLVVNSAIAVLNAVFVSGTIQTVSRFVAQGPEGAAGVLRSALRLNAVLAGVIAGAFFLAAPQIASLLNDPQLAPYLRVAAVIPLAYAFYASMIGFANGLRRFQLQAGFDVCFSVIKVALVVGLAWAGYGAFGAVSGFSTAAVLILLASWWTIGRPAVSAGPGPAPSAGTLLRFELAVMGHVGFTNLLMQLDLLLVQSLSVAGQASIAAAAYGSASKLAQIPYSVLVALNFLILPIIARSFAQSSKAETAQYVKQALRLGTALSAGPALVLACLAVPSITLVFGAQYAAAGPTLEVLALGYVAFSVWTLAATVVNGIGRPTVSLGLAVATVLAQLLLARTLIPEHGLMGAAIASSIAYLAGLAAIGSYLWFSFGPVVPWATLARVVVAGGVLFTVSMTPVAQLPVLIAAPLLGLLYLMVLTLLGEWRTEDLKAVMARRPLAASR